MSEHTQTHLPPNSREAEEALIGSVLLNPEILPGLDIESQDFYDKKHRVIWQVLNELEQIDYVTVSERLKAKKKLAEIGGLDYLTRLINTTATSYHAGEYAKSVRDYARRRGLLKLANEIAKVAYDNDKSIDVVTPEFIQKLADTSRIKYGAEHIKKFMSELWDDVEKKSTNPQDIWGIPTGFPAFDRVTGGLQEGELMLLSGEPGVGKSIFAMQLAAQMGESAPGVIYSLEMGSAQVARRLVSGQAKVPTRNLKSGRLQDNDWTNITQAIEKLSDLPIYMSDSIGWTTTSLRADLARLKAQAGVKWFVLDYLYLLNDGQGMDEIARTQMAATGLKRLTKEIGPAGVAIHSMNKSGMGISEAPTNASLRGSGQVVYDADLIIYLTKYKQMDDIMYSADEQERMRTLWFGKGRELEDPRKYINLEKTDHFPTFKEVSV